MHEFRTILVEPDAKEIVVDKDFVLYTACLDATLESDSPSSVIVEYKDSSFILCTLTPEVAETFNFRLDFYEGEIFKVYTKGLNKIHLNGAYTSEESNIISELSEESKSVFYSHIKGGEIRTIKSHANMELCIATLGPDIISGSRTSLIVEIDGVDVALCTLSSERSANGVFSFNCFEDKVYNFKTIGDNSIYLIGNYLFDEEEEMEEDEAVEDEPEYIEDYTEFYMDDGGSEASDDDSISADEYKILYGHGDDTNAGRIKGGRSSSSDKKPEARSQSRKGDKQAERGEDSQQDSAVKRKKVTFAEEEEQKELKKERKGVKITTLKQGRGEVVKKGDLVKVFYTGKLENGKVFDDSGKKPFKFRLGAGEVIRGWDIGIEGMKVGEKRRLVISPKLAYGDKKVGKIPANSKLTFDIYLKDSK
jgi:FK506-binding nuclear protein